MVTGSNTYYQPQNLGNAKNMGFEVDVVKFIRHFGLKANYTYTHSSITTNKRQYKPGSAEFEQGVKQTRPLVNQAPHTANLSLLYRGSSNQRLIDVPKTLAAGDITLWTPPGW